MAKMRRKNVLTLALALGLAAALVCGGVLGAALTAKTPDGASLLAATEDTQPRTLTVSGVGIVSAKPDTARLNIGVQTRNAKATAAQTANAQAMGLLLETLKQAGIEEKDLQTSNYSIWEDYTYSNGVSKPNGYVVSNTLTITVRDIGRVGDIIDQASASGANRINGIAFMIGDDSQLYRQAMQDAVSNAKAKAEALAAANGVSLGQVAAVAEYSYGGANRSYAELSDMRAAADAAQTPVAVGTMDVSASVTITSEIS
jgi:uncharacterized protein YggE